MNSRLRMVEHGCERCGTPMKARGFWRVHIRSSETEYFCSQDCLNVYMTDEESRIKPGNRRAAIKAAQNKREQH